MSVKISAPVRAIARLGPARRIAMRVYNRFLMAFHPVAEVRTFFGARMQCDVRDMVPATIRHLGSWEPRTSSVFMKLVKPGDVVADVGANIGYFSLLFSHRVGPNGSVVAFEPLPSALRQLNHSLTLNGIENVRVAAVAVGNQDGTVRLHEAPSTNTGMSSLTPIDGSAQTHEVPIRRLHESLTEGERARLALIKIDIEGAELPVLEDFIDHLDLYPRKPSLAVEANAGRDPSWPTVFQRLIDAGYRAFDLHNDYDWLTLVDEPKKEPAELTELPSRSVDMLFIPSR